ncbi:MAG: hypothetical protein KAJ70_01360 [Candidatus Omnitrophica bacterium]|nr:hypothetical protein [Candidatus Omnitrophota bacterium]
MMLKAITILIFLFTACSNGFCQKQIGKRDGIHREYYRNGTLKYEYMVKEERLNGFYERYDEEGELEYRQYYINGVFDGVDRKNYYYPLFFWYQHIGKEAQEVLLSDYEAVEMFGEDYELAGAPKEGNWMGIVRTRIPVGRHAEKKHSVTLAGLSKNYIYLKGYKDRKDIEPAMHYFYELIREYKVQRSDDVDDLFNVSFIEEVFQRRHTGVEFGSPFGNRKRREGSRLRFVQRYIGEPDYSFPLRPAGWFDVYYERENLHLVGHSSAVYFMESVKPEWADSPEYRIKKKRKEDFRN